MMSSLFKFQEESTFCGMTTPQPLIIPILTVFRLALCTSGGVGSPGWQAQISCLDGNQYDVGKDGIEG